MGESMFNGAESFNQCLSLWASKAKPTPPPPTQRPTVACPDNQAVDTDSQCQFWDIVRGHCEDTTDDVKEKMKACQKTCGVCVTRELSPAPSAAPSAACTNTKQANFKLKGSKQKKTCDKWHRKVNVVKRLLTKTEVDEFLRHALSHVLLTPNKENSN